MENAENKGSAFVYTYSAQKNKEIEMKGQAFSIALGVIGSLLLGIGMCCTMVWNFGIGMMIVGIIVGVCGMATMGLAYQVYKKLTEKERGKIAEEIIALSNELL